MLDKVLYLIDVFVVESTIHIPFVTHYWAMWLISLAHYINTTNVPYAIGPGVNPLQNRETQHVNIVLQCMYQTFEQPNMKGNHAWIEW
jgi:hypothetical protein